MLIAGIILLSLIIFILLTSYICFRKTFYTSRKEIHGEFDLPEGEIYKPYKDIMVNWMKEIKGTEKATYTLTSFDGLKLVGRYYENFKNAEIELMFHGYRGDAKRDLCGGVQRCKVLGRNAFIVDQRACGDSDGNIITFGINEKKDCISWINFLINEFGDDVKIIITGISMGATTVLLAAGEKLPKNVIGVLADCGFSSAKEIIKKTIKEMNLPPNLAYPLVYLGAKIYGNFNLNESNAVEAVKKAYLPIIYFHGESDNFVPCEMSKINYNATISKKKLITIKKAGHGLCYLVEPDTYVKELSNFFN
ncbi:MAG: alpha/beta hydrolase [Ruminococcaceae bacterium]|nr:alpha/beta hydrolase [Oscillospiraceae bacterium]